MYVINYVFSLMIYATTITTLQFWITVFIVNYVDALIWWTVQDVHTSLRYTTFTRTHNGLIPLKDMASVMGHITDASQNCKIYFT